MQASYLIKYVCHTTLLKQNFATQRKFNHDSISHTEGQSRICFK